MAGRAQALFEIYSSSRRAVRSSPFAALSLPVGIKTVLQFTLQLYNLLNFRLIINNGWNKSYVNYFHVGNMPRWSGLLRMQPCSDGRCWIIILIIIAECVIDTRAVFEIWRLFISYKCLIGCRVVTLDRINDRRAMFKLPHCCYFLYIKPATVRLVTVRVNPTQYVSYLFLPSPRPLGRFVRRKSKSFFFSF